MSGVPSIGIARTSKTPSPPRDANLHLQQQSSTSLLHPQVTPTSSSRRNSVSDGRGRPTSPGHSRIDKNKRYHSKSPSPQGRRPLDDTRGTSTDANNPKLGDAALRQSTPPEVKAALPAKSTSRSRSTSRHSAEFLVHRDSPPPGRSILAAPAPAPTLTPRRANNTSASGAPTSSGSGSGPISADWTSRHGL